MLRPLQDIDLRDGEEVILVVKRRPNIDRFVGVLGKASARELEAYEEEVYAPWSLSTQTSSTTSSTRLS